MIILLVEFTSRVQGLGREKWIKNIRTKEGLGTWLWSSGVQNLEGGGVGWDDEAALVIHRIHTWRWASNPNIYIESQQWLGLLGTSNQGVWHRQQHVSATHSHGRRFTRPEHCSIYYSLVSTNLHFSMRKCYTHLVRVLTFWISNANILGLFW